ncbi:MAG TPA: hypothetical protein VGB59_06655 [Allosphingosinicella sp.]|jgi:hypothetical protein
MALAKAVLIGGVAAVAIPYAMGHGTNEISDLVRRGTVDLGFSVGGTGLDWSWPIFCVITLFAWGFFAWAEK